MGCLRFPWQGLGQVGLGLTLALGLVAACSSSESGGATAVGDDAGVPGGSAGDDTDSRGGEGGQRTGEGGLSGSGGTQAGSGNAGAAGEAGAGDGRVLYGLETRPLNVTCVAPARPTDGEEDPFPSTLSATGCVDPNDPTKPASGLIAYDVNAPLWSDGATKHRYLALPEWGEIEVLDDGDWVLPIGTVLVKTFALGETLVETRLLMRHDDGEWAGYSYAWREDGSEADLLPTSLTRTFGAREWSYPSRENCLECHTQAAGRTLGLETSQLSRVRDYPLGRADQLATFEHIGLFSGALPEPAPAPYPDPLDAREPVAARARAYLHANCSYCHRPEGVSEVTIDLRARTSVVDMRVCDVNPSKGAFGIVGAKLVKPGDPAGSILSLRMHTEIAGVRMPPIGSLVADDEGAAVVDSWIAEISCQ